MKESIRNQFPGTIKSIVSDKVLSEVIVETASGEVASVITTHSVEDMTARKFLHEGLFGLPLRLSDSFQWRTMPRNTIQTLERTYD